MNLRAGTTDDAKAIADLIARFQREITNHPNGQGAENYFSSVSEQAEHGYLESNRYAFILAEDARNLLGFIALRDVTHVFHMFVAREHQRKGIARQLWHEARSQALLTSSSGVFTVNSSLAAVPVYRAFGFVPKGEVQSFHGISFLPMQFVMYPE